MSNKPAGFLDSMCLLISCQLPKPYCSIASSSLTSSRAVQLDSCGNNIRLPESYKQQHYHLEKKTRERKQVKANLQSICIYAPSCAARFPLPKKNTKNNTRVNSSHHHKIYAIYNNPHLCAQAEVVWTFCTFDPQATHFLLTTVAL